MGANQLIQLLYLSTATRDVSREELAEIGATAERRNGEDGITGILCFNGRNFMQLVEGERAAIDALMARLEQDERHSGIVVMYDELTTARNFGEWSMRVATVSAVTPARTHELDALLPADLPATLRDLMIGFGGLQ